jgi:hypothetical protein
MGRATWALQTDGAYWIDVEVGNSPLSWMIDTGMVDAQNWVGFELEPAQYDRLKRAGRLSYFRQRRRKDASGRKVYMECGLTSAQLVDPVSRRRIGPRVPIFVLRSVPNIPRRVGTAFFHRLTGCRVLWDLDNRLWSVEYP